jgi:hypothetical protein
MANVPAETLELAYKTFRECGQNLSETHRKMNGELGYVISRQSLHEWKTKYDWEGRAARAEAETQYLVEATTDKALLLPLIKNKKKYEDYFDSQPIGSMDTQAIHGYNATIKMIMDIRSKSAKVVADDVAKEVKRSGLSDEAAEEIRRKILGVSTQ